MRFRSAALVVLAALCGACQTTVTSTPPGLASALVARSHAARAWEVWEETRVAGSVVRYEEPTAQRRAWYSVRNAHQQELGVVDLQGRAWRYRAHAREPVWLGTGTVEEGVRRILGIGPNSALREVPLAALAAPAGR